MVGLLKSIINHYFIITESIVLAIYDEFLIPLQTNKPKLPDIDAVVVTRSWFPLQQKITVKKVEEESDEYGLLPPPKWAKLREALIHFGNELVDNECVTLKQPAGLTRSDVTKLLD